MFTVQCDFDDTITVSNVGEALLDEFVPEQWRDLDSEYLAGQFTVEESNRRKFALIKASEKAIHEFVSRTVEFRPGFLQFVEYCRKEHIGFVIVSCGLDQYMTLVFAKWIYLTWRDIRVEVSLPEMGSRLTTSSHGELGEMRDSRLPASSI